MTSWTVRRATPAEVPQIMTVFDAAMLEIEIDLVRAGIRSESAGSVFVAAASNRVLGALAIRRGIIEAVAVRRARRGQGIGSALVRRALAEHGTVQAFCPEKARPFYEFLGFEVRATGDDRYHCRLTQP